MKAGRGGFMRRFFTLVCLLCLAVPAGISISGCTRNPAANYCNGAGYGMKVGDVAQITLGFATTGISIAYGQTRQSSPPLAITCKGSSASAPISYGTTNNQIVDISPTGLICAGTWNRNTGGGIANYTICSPPNPLPSTGGLPYATAYITASAQSVVSNPVEVFVHAPVTSVSLVTQPLSGPSQQCYSQGSQATLDAEGCFVSNNTQYELCAPPSVTGASKPVYACKGGLFPGVTASAIPDCTAAIGSLTYTVGINNVGSIVTNTTSNQVTITAGQPGTTAITASVAGSGSSAGYFSTCPPASIKLALANGETAGTITLGVSENLVTTVTDSLGTPISGLNLDYQSTDPADITASSSGAIATAFPGVASVYAICQPPSCNPAPINEVGVYGTGLSVSSNPVTITTPGTSSDYIWVSAPGQSQYIVPIDQQTGTVGSTIRLPYVPNSMVMDRTGFSIYFGSSNELMIYNTGPASLSKQDPSVPGVVLAVSPNNTQLLINDQQRKLLYLYTVINGATTAIGGMGNAAAWTPDSKTLYVTDNAALNSTPSSPEQGITGHTDTLYVYNADTGWTTYPLPPSPLVNPLPPGVLPPSSLPAGLLQNPMPPNVAISSTVQTPALTIPSVGAYLRGTPTVAHTWCPNGTVGNYDSMSFYPQGPDPSDNSVTTQTDALVSTTDGQHILGASVTGGQVTLSDIGVTIPKLNCLWPESNSNYPLAIGDSLSPLLLTNTLNTAPLTQVSATAIDQVVASPESNLAFITYTANESNSNALLPYYQPNQTTPGALGTVGYIPLTTQSGGVSPSAPLAGAFTPDDKLFFVSTAGDNMVHAISVPLVTSDPAHADTQQNSPNLPACIPIAAGGNDAGCTLPATSTVTVVPATAIAIKPRSVT
jgi:hypothetical protein